MRCVGGGSGDHRSSGADFLRLVGLSSAIVKPPKSKNLPWGAWGVPNSVAHNTANCFDVVCHFNSVGARAKEPSLQGADRWAYVGASGYCSVICRDAKQIANLRHLINGPAHLLQVMTAHLSRIHAIAQFQSGFYVSQLLP